MKPYLPIFADIGARALLYLYVWLLSAVFASELSKRKGYSEKLGLGSGLLLSAAGLLIWLVIPAKAGFGGQGIRRFVPVGKDAAARARQGATTK